MTWWQVMVNISSPDSHLSRVVMKPWPFLLRLLHRYTSPHDESQLNCPVRGDLIILRDTGSSIWASPASERSNVRSIRVLEHTRVHLTLLERGGKEFSIWDWFNINNVIERKLNQTEVSWPAQGRKIINLLLWKYLWRPEWVRLEPRRSEEVKRKMIGRKSSDKSCYIFRHLVTGLWIFQCRERMRWVQGKSEV